MLYGHAWHTLYVGIDVLYGFGPITNSEIPNESQRLIHKSGNPLVSPY